jgi:hypothetical protein
MTYTSRRCDRDSEKVRLTSHFKDELIERYDEQGEQQMRILLAGEKSIPHSIATLDKVHGVAPVRDIVGWESTHT